MKKTKKILTKIMSVLLTVIIALSIGLYLTENKVKAAEVSGIATLGSWTVTVYEPMKYISSDGAGAVFLCDFTGEVAMAYNGTKSGDYLLTIVDLDHNVLLDENGNPYAYEVPITNTSTFDFSIVPDTQFIARYERHIPGTHMLPDKWSVLFNNEKITVSTEVNQPINPTEITNTTDRPDAEITWQIKDEDNNIVLSGTGTTVSQQELENLPDGNYSVWVISEDETIYGNSLTAEDSTNFVVRRPDPTITIDKPINPDSVTVDKKLPDSELSWVLKDSNGQIVAEGTGTNVPIPEIPGVYTVEVTETSTEGLVAVTSGTFEITDDETTDSNDNNEDKNNTNKDNNKDDVTKLPDSGTESIFMFIVIMWLGTGILVYNVLTNKKSKNR